ELLASGLAAALDGDGARAFSRVLLRLERRPLARRAGAVEAGLRARAHGRDAIAQFRLPREDWRATTFSLEGRDHLRHVVVAHTDVAAYRSLLAEGGAS